MPFGPYADFQACIDDNTSKGKDVETAKKICGAMQTELGGAETNFVDFTVNKEGELYLKYFLIDASLAQNTAAGDFSVSPEAIAANEQKAVGIPFAVLPSRDLSIFGDFHSWSPEPNASLQQHRDFASKYAPGYVAAITKDSSLISGGVNSIKANGGRFAIVHINDKRARDAYIANPALIPKAVSPGIINYDAPIKYDIKNFDWAHLAGVPTGAYGDKATLYGKCLGPKSQCLNHLMAASILERSQKEHYCPVGASENLLSEGFSSLAFSEGNSSTVMSVNPTVEPIANATTTAVNPINPASASPPAQTGAPINPTPSPMSEQGQNKPVLRLKNALANPNDPNQQGRQTVDLKEHEKLKKEFEEFKLSQEQNARKEAIKRLVPPQLFIEKGKFNETAYNAEIDKRLGQGWDDATIQDYYDMKLKLVSQQSTNPVNPLGGSRYQYETPSEVPTGGNNVTDYETTTLQAVNSLLKWTRGLR